MCARLSSARPAFRLPDLVRRLAGQNAPRRASRGRRTLRPAKFYVLALAIAAGSPSGPVLAGSDLANGDREAFAYNRALGRGINIGDALDAPAEGAWGVTLKKHYFQAIKDAGFDSVRIPIRWSAHAQSVPPYAIDAAFFERVDWAIDQALSRHLAVIIDVHHYLEMDRDPGAHTPRLVALWRQIAARYRDRSPSLSFELFNEPADQLTDERWQQVFPALLQAIRASDPDRIVIVGPVHQNSLEYLSSLQLPANDRRIIATFHYYAPLQFTHQGADWVANSVAWKGTTWGTTSERAKLREDFDKAANWALAKDRPLYLGEFGAIGLADMTSRVLWTATVAREAERRNFSWAYWEFCAKFGAYDPAAEAWRQPLLRALLAQ
jgi:endoglucanase